MNGKKAKHLRWMATNMFAQLPAQNITPSERKLMVHPADERRAKEQGNMLGCRAVNHQHSHRGIYRWLKANRP